jgi:hypothetical protein
MMTDAHEPIADEAIDSLSVAPPRPDQDGDTPAAGSSGDPERDDQNVDIGSEDSMDASDPPSTSAPGSNRDVEQAREEGRQKDA